MNSKELRQEWRRSQAAKVREERIITAYVKEKHPEIYSKAAELYNKLNQKYPKKYDLRKVKEFKTLILGIPPEQQKYQEKHFPNITVNVQPTFTDCLQLRIPLLSPVQLPPVSPVQPSPVSPVQLPPVSPVQPPPVSPVQPSPVSPVQLPPVSPVQPPPVSPVQLPSVSPVQQPPVSPVPEPALFCTIEKEGLIHIPEIDDDVINKIVADLQNDPFIHDFFEDMEIEELTPLESELLLW